MVRQVINGKVVLTADEGKRLVRNGIKRNSGDSVCSTARGNWDEIEAGLIGANEEIPAEKPLKSSREEAVAMTKAEAYAYRAKIERAATKLTDEEALTSPLRAWADEAWRVMAASIKPGRTSLPIRHGSRH